MANKKSIKKVKSTSASKTAKPAPAKKPAIDPPAVSVSTTTTTSARAASDENIFGLPMVSWVGSARRARANELRTGKRAFVIAINPAKLESRGREFNAVKKLVSPYLNSWQLRLFLEADPSGKTFQSHYFQTESGPVWILRAPFENPPTSDASLEKSGYARFRDGVGPVVSPLQPLGTDRLIIESHGLTADEEMGLLIGLEMASYYYQENRGIGKRSRRRLPELLLKSGSFAAPTVRAASNMGLSINISRHLVNLPPNDLNPRSYARTIETLFSSSRAIEVDIWEGEKLRDERMNLLISVGRAAQEKPRFIHLKYRPNSEGVNKRPIAIVGKGITFDSGGLDIKPAAGMRWMKKDMGGSAAVVALAKWAELTAIDQPLDFYLSIAENSVGGDAFRPGDVIVARSGLSVEIQNTDAEGRLVLADALDVAAGQEGVDAPSAIINVATLTGANKVALGSEIAGLYSNNDALATQIFNAGRDRGDLAWRIPMYQPYRAQLKSSFADCQNSADGFGGAITAALFLESFVRQIPFAHLDIYAWKDGAGGAFSETGGNGQSVQGLAEYLLRLKVEG